jgi:hypothetical protein
VLPRHTSTHPTLHCTENKEGCHNVTRIGTLQVTQHHWVNTPCPWGPYNMEITPTTTTPIHNTAFVRSIDKYPWGGYTHSNHTPKPEGTHKKLIFTDTDRQNPQTIYTALSHTQTQVGTYPLNDPAYRKSKHHTYFHTQSTFSPNNTRTFCNNLQLNKPWMSTVHPTCTRNDPHTLTNPNRQPYLKYKLNTNMVVTIEEIPAKYTATPTEITTNTTNTFPPNINDLPLTNNTRPIHRTNGHAAQYKHYID